MKWITISVVFGSMLIFCGDHQRLHSEALNLPEPVQKRLVDPKSFFYKGVAVTPRYRFQVHARVLSKKNYRLGRAGKICPVDLALGWGPMSNDEVLKELNVKQRSRFYFWSVRDYPISKKEITVNSANMHIIPADEKVTAELKAVRKGDVIKFSGFLVNLRAEDGWRWKTSERRSDSGGGACELVWVEDIIRLDR
jgi:hypothetical protein